MKSSANWQAGSLYHNAGCVVASGRLACVKNVETPVAGWKACPKWIQDLVDVLWLSPPAIVIDIVDLDLVVQNAAAHTQ